MTHIIDNIKFNLICPITLEIPSSSNYTIGNDNCLYNKTSLLVWLDRNPTSPYNKKPMTFNDLGNEIQ